MNLAKGAASFKFAGFATPGYHAVQAVYNPTANFADESSNGVNVDVFAVSTVTLSSSAASVAAGNPVTFSAAVTGLAGVPTGMVSFYDGKTFLGAFTLDAAGIASITLTNLATGAHTITAVYSGDATYAAGTTASALHQIITPRPNGRLV